jgi:large subunit ribosomal protein L4
VPKLSMFDMSGKSVGEVEASEKVFGAKPNSPIVHSALLSLNTTRVVKASTKTRGEVRGGGKKPWKQKGTGNARAGSSRSPLFAGGGVTFGPKTRNVVDHLPKKAKRKAMCTLLSDKAREGKLKIVDELKLDEIKTKKMIGVLKALGVEGKKVLLVLGKRDENIEKSSSNIPNLDLAVSPNINVYEVLKNEVVLMTKDAANVLMEVLK